MIEIEYKIIRYGKLKYNKIKSLLLFKKSYDIFNQFKLTEIKEIFNKIYDKNFNNISFDFKLKKAIDLIYDNVEYSDNSDEIYENNYCSCIIVSNNLPTA